MMVKVYFLVALLSFKLFYNSLDDLAVIDVKSPRCKHQTFMAEHPSLGRFNIP
jgi:hypothetical protein